MPTVDIVLSIDIYDLSITFIKDMRQQLPKFDSGDKDTDDVMNGVIIEDAIVLL